MWFMELLLFSSWAFLWGFVVFMYLDMKHTLKSIKITQEMIDSSYINDVCFRSMRLLVEKDYPWLYSRMKKSIWRQKKKDDILQKDEK